METVRMVADKVPLDLAEKLWYFIKSIHQYEIFVREQEFTLPSIPGLNMPKRFKLIKPHVEDGIDMKSNREFACVIGVDNALNAIFVDLLAIGNINRAVVDPIEAYRTVFVTEATGIILCHNHPSGRVEPSTADMITTKFLVRAGITLSRPLIEHLVFNDEHFFSMSDNGIMEQLREKAHQELKYDAALDMENMKLEALLKKEAEEKNKLISQFMMEQEEANKEKRAMQQAYEEQLRKQNEEIKRLKGQLKRK